MKRATAEGGIIKDIFTLANKPDSPESGFRNPYREGTKKILTISIRHVVPYEKIS